MRKLLLVAFAVAFIACVSAENEDRYRSERDERFRPYRSGPDLTRDDILHNLDKRKRTLEATLESTKKNLADHNDGTEKVDDAVRYYCLHSSLAGTTTTRSRSPHLRSFIN